MSTQPDSTVERSTPRPGIAQLTMNRPATLNAMTAELVQSLHDHLDEIAVDPDVRVVVLTGAGRGFCAGLDLGGYGATPHTAAMGRTQSGFATQKHIASLIPQLRLLHEQHATTERQIDRVLAQLAQPDTVEGKPTEHRDAEILQSLPGVGRVVAATMLTEASGLLAARDYATLRAYTGAAPITKRSGKRVFLVRMRYACNGRLREALYHWCRTSLQHDAAARAYYDGLRARGHAHGRALRSVGDRWLRILIAMLNAKTLYDGSRFEQTQTMPT